MRRIPTRVAGYIDVTDKPITATQENAIRNNSLLLLTVRRNRDTRSGIRIAWYQKAIVEVAHGHRLQSKEYTITPYPRTGLKRGRVIIQRYFRVVWELRSNIAYVGPTLSRYNTNIDTFIRKNNREIPPEIKPEIGST